MTTFSILVGEALLAAVELEKEGIGSIVLNNHTIKPMDEKTIIECAQRCNRVVCCEDHQLAGGMGSAVSEILSQNHPIKISFVAVKDTFGESGKTEELKEKYELTYKHIIKASKKWNS